MRKYLAVAAIALAACSSDTPAGPSEPVEPNYSVAVSGDRSDARTGVSLTTYLANGWSEESNGVKRSSDVTLLLLADRDVTQPQTNLGLLGRARVGTYHVRVPATPFGSRLELYASYRVRNPDGTSSVYDATSGTVTITDVTPAIRGTFTFHSSRVVVWPATVTVGMTLQSQPASLDVTGSFVARTP